MAVGGANNIAMVREFDSRHLARDLRERWVSGIVALATDFQVIMTVLVT